MKHPKQCDQLITHCRPTLCQTVPEVARYNEAYNQFSFDDLELTIIEQVKVNI